MARYRTDAAPISWLHVFGLVVILWAVSSETFAQGGEAVVTEVRGTAVRSNSSALRTLDALKVGDRVRLSSDSRVTLFVAQDALLYEIVGPAEVSLSPKGPLANGKPVDARKVDEAYRNVKVNGSELVQGSMVMRSQGTLRVLAPEGVVTTSDARSFTWTQQPGTWRFELATDAGALLHRAEARDGRLVLPVDVVIPAGVKCVWGILPAQGGTTPIDWTEFVIADAGGASARLGEESSSSEKLLHAAWLKSRGLERAAVRVASSAAR